MYKINVSLNYNHLCYDIWKISAEGSYSSTICNAKTTRNKKTWDKPTDDV